MAFVRNARCSPAASRSMGHRLARGGEGGGRRGKGSEGKGEWGEEGRGRGGERTGREQKSTGVGGNGGVREGVALVAGARIV